MLSHKMKPEIKNQTIILASKLNFSEADMMTKQFINYWLESFNYFVDIDSYSLIDQGWNWINDLKVLQIYRKNFNN